MLGAGLWQGILALAAALSAVTLGVGAVALDRGLPWQSMVFVTLGLCQLGLALAVRPPGPRWRNPGLLGAVALSALAQVAAVALPPLRALLGTEPLTVPQLAACVMAAAVPALTYHAWSRWRDKR